MKAQLETLQGQTGWKDLNTRMLKGQEFADIIGDKNWTKTGTNMMSVMNTNGVSPYYWLYDYTITCKAYGCRVESSYTYGYWLEDNNCESNEASCSKAWSVWYTGQMFADDKNVSRLRPVIIVSK